MSKDVGREALELVQVQVSSALDEQSHATRRARMRDATRFMALGPMLRKGKSP